MRTDVPKSLFEAELGGLETSEEALLSALPEGLSVFMLEDDLYPRVSRPQRSPICAEPTNVDAVRRWPDAEP